MAAAEASPSTSSDKEIYFVLDDQREIKVHNSLQHLSGFLKDFLKSLGEEQEGNSIKIPTKDVGYDEVELLNKFVAFLEQHHKDQVRNEQDRKDFWMEFIPSNREELRPLAKDVDKDLLITAANAGDFLIVPAFISFCTYFLCERAQNLKLKELREFLNEEADFDEEQLRIIRECPEFDNL
ncbi:unnamed protein product [Bursaphelenchus xylophilus]|uniref:(pine wood nematode) hypothetical protein n=1 Tax=Bursaphelenchus xylophilus TaxID=6326 RepID=A0A1I7SWT8_BURXY|nr:unnamed protein product [Bursaphelenchus xylophilus]CAG9099910.1 unnamed protein product [Bursaphelenchus xylophilus]